MWLTELGSSGFRFLVQPVSLDLSFHEHEEGYASNFQRGDLGL